MKKLLTLSFSMLLACGDAAGEPPVTASCAPKVNVTVPAAKTKRPKTKIAAPSPHQEVVHVYWDVSKSMRDFAATGSPRGSKGETTSTDDLTPVVVALDTSLLRAYARHVEQYGVGESIEPLPSVRAALQPKANRTALHLAAERIGTALATGGAQAALVISDMELDTPPRVAGSPAVVCGNVPLPSTREAGSLFGRCFESAALASDSRLTRSNLLVHVFRKSSHGRELFILLVATDRAFGRRISDEVARRLDFSRHVIFDSGAVAAANVRGCTVTAPRPGVRLGKGPPCVAKCFDKQASIQAECDVRRQDTRAWIEPAGQGLDGVSYETLKKKPGDGEEQARVRFAIPCNTPPGTYDAAVSFRWRVGTAWSRGGNAAFSANANVRDLFESLTDAIVRTVEPRRLRIGIELRK